MMGIQSLTDLLRLSENTIKSVKRMLGSLRNTDSQIIIVSEVVFETFLFFFARDWSYDYSVPGTWFRSEGFVGCWDDDSWVDYAPSAPPQIMLLIRLSISPIPNASIGMSLRMKEVSLITKTTRSSSALQFSKGSHSNAYNYRTTINYSSHIPESRLISQNRWRKTTMRGGKG